ncbi:hypothetical protein, partial [Roseovarius sp. SYSU LYC5161]|uniref:hypothetical protein n=1 Tax=Roseovarius halophilus (ex Wu et al. 2025) TaxID=3376060 RepID=UPI00399976EF
PSMFRISCSSSLLGGCDEPEILRYENLKSVPKALTSDMRKSTVIAFAAFTGLVACAADYQSKQKVVVEGEAHLVFKMNAQPNAYQAREEEFFWDGGYLDPNDYRKNVLAIEAATGCTVIPSSILNKGVITQAAVSCD